MNRKVLLVINMKRFYYIILLSLFFVVKQNNLISQELVINNDYYLMSGDIEIDANSNLIIYAAANDSAYFWRPMIIKVAPDFSYTSYIVDDTLNSLSTSQLLVTQSNKYLLTANEMPEGSYDFERLVIMSFDENLNMLFFKRYDLEPQYDGEATIHLIQNDDGRIFGFGSRTGDVFVALELNENGDTLKTKIIEPQYGTEINSWVINSNNPSTAFYSFVDGFEYSTGLWKVMTVDTSFNYSWEFIEPGGESPQYVVANWLNDSIYMGIGFKVQPGADEDLLIYKANANQNHSVVGSPLVIVRPEDSDILVGNTPTFFNKDFIYAGSNSPSWPDIPYESGYMVCLIDEDLNLIGMKSFLKEGYQYDLNQMYATDDLGCFLVGHIHNLATDSIYDIDLFIRKIMPGEIVEVAEHTEDPYDSDYFIYPNPGSDELNINTARKEVELRIVDIAGKEVIRRKLNDTFLNTLNVTQLPSGNYLLQFKDKEGYQESLKWIKK